MSSKFLYFFVNNRTIRSPVKCNIFSNSQVYKFFKTAAKLLNEDGKEDEAFYMEQMVDHLKSGKPLPTSEEGVIKALGL